MEAATLAGPAHLARENRPTRSRVMFRCPDCRSFFDLPRVNPVTVSVAQKCSGCNTWHPLISEVTPQS